MYQFRGWTIETKVDGKLHIVIEKEEEYLVILDEDKDLFALIYPSEFGEGLTFEKVVWNTQVHVLDNEKKIIFTSSKKAED